MVTVIVETMQISVCSVLPDTNNLDNPFVDHRLQYYVCKLSPSRPIDLRFKTVYNPVRVDGLKL